jgi:hypothetical protein
MSRISEIKHRPKVRIWIRFTDLIQWRFIRVYNLVDRITNTSILDCPSELARCFTSDGIVGSDGGVAWVGSGGWSRRWEELGYTEVTLRRRRKEVVDGILNRQGKSVNESPIVEEESANSHSRCVCKRPRHCINQLTARGNHPSISLTDRSTIFAGVDLKSG